MTDCVDIRAKLSALLDNELPESEAAEVQSHLDGCDPCGQQWQQLQSLDNRLKRALTIDDVAEKVSRIQQAALVAPAEEERQSSSLIRFPSIIAVVAATILLAFLATRPQEEPPVAKVKPPIIVAHLIRATGTVDVQPSRTDQWQSIQEVENFPLAEGTRLKTDKDILCELKTSDDCKVRIDQLAEIVIHDSSKVELLSGQLWCLAPKQSGIDIEILLRGTQPPESATMSCPPTAEIQCVAGESIASCDSLSSQNEPTAMVIGTFRCPVAPGETVSVDANQNVQRKEIYDARKIWQLPLLAVGHRVDEELIGSMNTLLTPIGRTKARHLNEQQIRRLGPKGALPLLAFAKSETSPAQLRLRRTAVNIAADLADQSAIDLLQHLASDPDSLISRRANDALKRIAQEAD